MKEWERHYSGGPVILVVDDDSRVRAYIRTVLESAQIQVLEAGDGVEALELFHIWRKRIALVITDLRMPRMTGMELATSLRSLNPSVRLVFVSGEPVPIDWSDFSKGSSFLEKPFTPKVLLQAARRFFDLPIVV